MASDDELEIRFQEAHGAYLFGQGKPRAVLEVKSPDISKATMRRACGAMTEQRLLQGALFKGVNETR